MQGAPMPGPQIAAAPAMAAPPRPSRLLVIEDDPVLAHEIASALSRQHHEVELAPDGTSGLALALAAPFDLVVTDRMLPELDGLDLIGQMRAAGVRAPVLVLSALGAAGERVRGLNAGADDYLAKPFDLDELIARVAALLRRAAPGDGEPARQTVLRAGPVVMDLLERTVHRGAREVDLLPREFKLLEYLMRHPNHSLTRAMLLRDVWRYRFAPDTNLVDVHIGKLRRKLSVGDEPDLIVSVRGAGFMFVTDAR